MAMRSRIGRGLVIAVAAVGLAMPMAASVGAEHNVQIKQDIRECQRAQSNFAFWRTQHGKNPGSQVPIDQMAYYQSIIDATCGLTDQAK